MNGMFKGAAETDPKWARRETRKVLWVKILTPITVFAVMIGAVALILSIHNGTEITQIQHSACQVDPAGKECQKTKAESSRDADLRVTCIPFFKAGYPCPKPGSTAAGREARRQSLRAHGESSGGDATSAPTGHSQPAPVDGGSTGSGGTHHATAPGETGSHEAPAPVKGGSGGAPEPANAGSTALAAPTSSQSSSSSTTERVESTTVETPAAEAPAPVRSAVGGVVEGVTGTVEETGGTVNETVGGVTCTLHLTC